MEQRNIAIPGEEYVQQFVKVSKTMIDGERGREQYYVMVSSLTLKQGKSVQDQDIYLLMFF